MSDSALIYLAGTAMTSHTIANSIAEITTAPRITLRRTRGSTCLVDVKAMPHVIASMIDKTKAAATMLDMSAGSIAMRHTV
jgi:hypothetical protein